MSHWPERDAELKRLIEEKLTAREIAERMGISKNAVCGRAHRMHWSIKGQLKGPRTPAGIERVRKSRPPRLPSPTLTLEEIFPELQNIAPAAPSAPSIRYGQVSLMELSDHQCHYIAGEASGGYCGHKAEDLARPYCAQHMRLIYQPARR